MVNFVMRFPKIFVLTCSDTKGGFSEAPGRIYTLQEHIILLQLLLEDLYYRSILLDNGGIVQFTVKNSLS